MFAGHKCSWKIRVFVGLLLGIFVVNMVCVLRHVHISLQGIKNVE